MLRLTKMSGVRYGVTIDLDPEFPDTEEIEAISTFASEGTAVLIVGGLDDAAEILSADGFSTDEVVFAD